MVYDEQFRIVGSQSGIVQAGASPFNWNSISTSNPVTIDQAGYLVVYISNETDWDVSFDNVNVDFPKGNMVEQNHYYPYGLKVSLGSSNFSTNRYLYQGKQLEETAGLNLYDFEARQYDPQLGRFTSLDPMGQFWSGYIGMGNNPVSIIDPTGMLVQDKGTVTSPPKVQPTDDNNPNIETLSSNGAGNPGHIMETVTIKGYKFNQFTFLPTPSRPPENLASLPQLQGGSGGSGGSGSNGTMQKTLGEVVVTATRIVKS
jgi:RHS repeat-associated protein